jgi:hypothetical protein
VLEKLLELLRKTENPQYSTSKLAVHSNAPTSLFWPGIPLLIRHAHMDWWMNLSKPMRFSFKHVAHANTHTCPFKTHNQAHYRAWYRSTDGCMDVHMRIHDSQPSLFQVAILEIIITFLNGWMNGYLHVWHACMHILDLAWDNCSLISLQAVPMDDKA